MRNRRCRTCSKKFKGTGISWAGRFLSSLLSPKVEGSDVFTLNEHL